MQRASEDEAHTTEPLVSYRSMFAAEVEQAERELRRPAAPLFHSGVIAGMAVGIGVLLIALLVENHGSVGETPHRRLAHGAAYATGFVLAILGRSDLFTEYTTIAILPVMTGDASLGALGRLWAIVFAGNLVGGGAMAALSVLSLGPGLGLAEPDTFASMADHLAGYDAATIFASAVLAGWLMGLLSWLLTGGRDTTSQIVFIALVGLTIGGLGLHHSITGAVEMVAGALAGGREGWAGAARVIALAAVGNAVGGLIFAAMIHRGVGRHRCDGEHARRDDDVASREDDVEDAHGPATKDRRAPRASRPW